MKRAKIIFLIFILTISVIGCSKKIQKAKTDDKMYITNIKTINLATLDWPPYISPDFQDKGYVFEIVEEAFKRVGYKVKIKFYPWPRTMRLAERGVVDGYFPEYYNPDLKKHFVFSKAYPGGPAGFFKRKDKNLGFKTVPNMKDFTALKKHRLGVVRSYTNTEHLDNADYLTKDETTSDTLNLRKLYNDRVQLIFIDPNVARYLIQKDLIQKFPDALEVLEFMRPALEDKLLYTCISKKAKNYKEKIEAFNEGLSRIQKDGTLDRLLKKHQFKNGLWLGTL